MRKTMLMSLLLLLLAILRGHSQQVDPYALLHEGDGLPEFEVEMTNGERLHTAELEGKVVWITLWASWCPSCRKEFKRLDASEEFGALVESEDFLFLPIARQESSATVTHWLRNKGYTFRSGVDPERAVYDLFATQEIPRNILVAPDGTIVAHHSSYSKKALKELCAKASELLEEAGAK